MVSVTVGILNFQPSRGKFLQFLGFANRRGRLSLEPTRRDALLIWRLECLLPGPPEGRGFYGVGVLA